MVLIFNLIPSPSPKKILLEFHQWQISRGEGLAPPPPTLFLPKKMKLGGLSPFNSETLLN